MCVRNITTVHYTIVVVLFPDVSACRRSSEIALLLLLLVFFTFTRRRILAAVPWLFLVSLHSSFIRSSVTAESDICHIAHFRCLQTEWKQILRLNLRKCLVARSDCPNNTSERA